jgi:hypothetical protein
MIKVVDVKNTELACFSVSQAKLGDEMLDYKDLAALPKIKAIYNIDRPDMLSYAPYVSYPSEERHYGDVRGDTGKEQGSCVLFFFLFLSLHKPTTELTFIRQSRVALRRKSILPSCFKGNSFPPLNHSSLPA